MSIVKTLIPTVFCLGVVPSPLLTPQQKGRLGINFPIMGQEGWEGDITEEGRILPLALFPLQERHFDRIVYISTFKSYNKIYAYVIDIARKKIQT